MDRCSQVDVSLRIAGTEIAACAKSEAIDGAEVAVIDGSGDYVGSDTDAKVFHDMMVAAGAGKPNWIPY